MIIYTLDAYFQREDIITDYVSCIWTDRWDSYGDFELVLPDSQRYRNILPGKVLESGRRRSSPMLIETITTNSREKTISFKGRSVEMIADNVFLNKSEIIKGTTEYVAAEVFRRATNYDRYHMTFGRELDLSVFAIGTGRTSDQQVIYQTNDDSVYKQFTSVLSGSYAGYYIENIPGGSNPAWRIIASAPISKNNMVLSTAMKDFEYFSTVRSISSYRNVAAVRYTTGPETTSYLMVRNPQFMGATNFSWEQATRMVLVDATSLKREDYATEEDFMTSVRREGYIKLGEQRYIHSFDGKLNPKSRFVYGRDYVLGDIIPVLNDQKRYSALVTEYIYSATKDEIQEYPTLEFF